MLWAICFERIDPRRAIPLLVHDPHVQGPLGSAGAGRHGHKWTGPPDKGQYPKPLWM